MKALELRKIEKLYFGYEDIAKILNISKDSARVVASRYVKAGVLVRIKRNLYMLYEKWIAATTEQTFEVANLIEVPSYVSLMTALSYYEVTTQIQQKFIESIAIKRTKEVEIQGTKFCYSKIKSSLYFGFMRKRGFFIAEPEKAFLDLLYFKSLGRRSVDFSSIDYARLNWSKIRQFVDLYPAATQKLLRRYEYS